MSILKGDAHERLLEEANAVCPPCGYTWAANFRNVWPKCPRCDAGALQNRRALKQSSEAAGAWVIWSNEHRAWWAADRRGYRLLPWDAGRYTLEEAMSICKVRSFDAEFPPETMLHESTLPLPPEWKA